jgi:hypothetical protein
MTERHNEAARLHALLRDPAASEELTAYLVANSHLPGPRGNLELAKTFADQVASIGADEARWRLFQEWLAISTAEAPTGDPREFLPFCALQALGALYDQADDARRREALALIRAAAGDARWRVREGAAMALQRIGLQHAGNLIAIIADWLPSASLLEQRAIIAALAEPPLLRQPELARYALAVADQIMARLHALDRATRKTEPFRVLRQGLAYALSVIVAASPVDGFARLRAWAVVDDPDVKRIVRANLGKARLAKHEQDVRRVLTLL